jgi:hypothetical protein
MLEPSNNDELPAIPGKRYFTIGEVSDLCAVKPHVLRYWEQEFTQLRPMKRRGNRRYSGNRNCIFSNNHCWLRIWIRVRFYFGNWLTFCFRAYYRRGGSVASFSDDGSGSYRNRSWAAA